MPHPGGKMNDDLRPVFEGLEYCRQKRLEIHAEFHAFCRQSIKSELLGDPKVSAALVATLVDPVPVRFAREVGTTLNEVRVQLDYLANVLGRRNGANSPDSSFPIVTEAVKFKDAKNKIRQLSADDRKKIKELQPYQDEADTQVLIHLHAADIFRKHHAPMGARVTASTIAGGYGKIGSMSATGDGLFLEAGTRRAISYMSEVTMQIGCGFRLEVLEPETIRGTDALEFLDHSIDCVEFVVSQFA